MGQASITLEDIIKAADCNACHFTENGAVWLWNEYDDGGESGAVIVSIRDGKVYTGTCADYIGDWRVPEYLRHAELDATPEEGETMAEAAAFIVGEYIKPILAITSREGISGRSKFWGCAA
jgi:hypothetical protein